MAIPIVCVRVTHWGCRCILQNSKIRFLWTGLVCIVCCKKVADFEANDLLCLIVVEQVCTAAGKKWWKCGKKWFMQNSQFLSKLEIAIPVHVGFYPKNFGQFFNSNNWLIGGDVPTIWKWPTLTLGTNTNTGGMSDYLIFAVTLSHCFYFGWFLQCNAQEDTFEWAHNWQKGEIRKKTLWSRQEKWGSAWNTPVISQDNKQITLGQDCLNKVDSLLSTNNSCLGG